MRAFINSNRQTCSRKTARKKEKKAEATYKVMAFKGSNSFTTRTSIKNKTEKTDLYNKYSHGDDQGPDFDDLIYCKNDQ